MVVGATPPLVIFPGIVLPRPLPEDPPLVPLLLPLPLPPPDEEVEFDPDPEPDPEPDPPEPAAPVGIPVNETDLAAVLYASRVFGPEDGGLTTPDIPP